MTIQDIVENLEKMALEGVKNTSVSAAVFEMLTKHFRKNPNLGAWIYTSKNPRKMFEKIVYKDMTITELGVRMHQLKNGEN